MIVVTPAISYKNTSSIRIYAISPLTIGGYYGF